MALIKTEWWTGDIDELEPTLAHVDIERTDRDEIAMHTIVDGEGSKNSYYWSREGAIEVARQLLNAAQ